MLIRELKLSWNSALAVIEIDNFRNGRSHGEFKMMRQVAATLRALFLQTPSAPDYVRGLLLKRIVLAYHEKNLPLNWREWKYGDEIRWLEEKIKALEKVVSAKEAKSLEVSVLEEALTFCHKLSNGASAYEREYEPTLR